MSKSRRVCVDMDEELYQAAVKAARSLRWTVEKFILNAVRCDRDMPYLLPSERREPLP